ncbi:MFS transporter [Leifsonia sp. AG29]|uniref:MFS transporter n=1 Tax=Leifsonia sp. AG29 TaxID=2598860 RepID=UPI00131B6FDA|nr:MFS transporter [Leifsonia sp. AG29]
MRRRHAAFWLHAAVLIVFIGGSAAPSPLYAQYAHEWALGPIAVTAVFAVYAAAILITLLITGSLADHLGTRPVLIVAIVLEIAAMLLFASAASPAALIAARVIQGVATGATMSAAGSALMAFENPDRPAGSLLNSLASPVGLSSGALGSSLLVGLAPAPAQVVYLTIAALLVVLGIPLAMHPQTGGTLPWTPRSLVPRLRIPAAAVKTVATAMPVGAATWALGGFYLSLGPSITRSLTHNPAVIIGGLALFALFFPAAITVFARRWSDRTTMLVGVTCLVTGVSVTALAVVSGSALLYFVGTMVAGCGFGSGYSGSLRVTLPLAAPHERAGMFSAVYVICYLGFSVPAVAAGALTTTLGLKTTTLIYGAALVVAAIPALITNLRPARKRRTAVATTTGSLRAVLGSTPSL